MERHRIGLALLVAGIGAAAGALVPVVGWARFFVITCLAAIPGLILLLIMRRPLNERASREAARSNA